MAALALPIRELEQSVGIAQVATECVIRYSRERSEEFQLICRIVGKTLSLKHQLRGLSIKQGNLLSSLIERDFTHCDPGDLTPLAASLDKLVRDDRTMLDSMYELGVEIRFCWSSSLRKLAQQVDHLDSIAESLHAAADPECSMLMAIAAEQFEVQGESQVAAPQRQFAAH